MSFFNSNFSMYYAGVSGYQMHDKDNKIEKNMLVPMKVWFSGFVNSTLLIWNFSFATGDSTLC